MGDKGQQWEWEPQLFDRQVLTSKEFDYYEIITDHLKSNGTVLKVVQRQMFWYEAPATQVKITSRIQPGDNLTPTRVTG